MWFRDDTYERNKKLAIPVKIVELDLIFPSIASVATFLGVGTVTVVDALRGYKTRTDRPSGRTAYTTVRGLHIQRSTQAAYDEQYLPIGEFINHTKQHARGIGLLVNDDLLHIMGVERQEFWHAILFRARVEHADLRLMNYQGAISVEWVGDRRAA